VSRSNSSSHRRGAAGTWFAIDVLRDRLSILEVPVLGGLPIGDGPQSVTVPVGTTATIDLARAR
jgi:muramoyltetrapeptide carboxypeptidase LdcA involved in peptidoglycan recycling